MPNRNEDGIRCCFCGKPQSQVGKMIAGLNGAYICEDCVGLCMEVLEEENEQGGKPDVLS